VLGNMQLQPSLLRGKERFESVFMFLGDVKRRSLLTLRLSSRNCSKNLIRAAKKIQRLTITKSSWSAMFKKYSLFTLRIIQNQQIHTFSEKSAE
jgi:hypothetical protein